MLAIFVWDQITITISSRSSGGEQLVGEWVQQENWSAIQENKIQETYKSTVQSGRKFSRRRWNLVEKCWFRKIVSVEFGAWAAVPVVFFLVLVLRLLLGGHRHCKHECSNVPTQTPIWGSFHPHEGRKYVESYLSHCSSHTCNREW